MSLSPNELSFCRLLERAKRLSRENLRDNVWKVHAASLYLGNLLGRMQDEKSLHSADVLMQYGREVNQLNMMVEAEQRKDSEEKLAGLDRIPRLFPSVRVDGAELSHRKNAKDSPSPSVALPESSAGVRARNRTFYEADLRKQLLGDDQRRLAKESVDDVARHEQIQEELANDLLLMTKSLKQNITAAGNVIKEDNKRLTEINSQADLNKERLTVEGERLAHHAYKCGFDCLLVFVALFIFWSFICMVVLMKIFPKRIAA